VEGKLFVGNMAYDMTEEQLRTMFTEAGPVVAVDVIKDRHTGASKGFAFVTMGSPVDAETAIRLFDGKEVAGRPLTVNPAKPREDTSGEGRFFNGPSHRSRGGSRSRY